MYRCGSLFDPQIHKKSSIITNFNVYEDEMYE